MSKHKHYDMIVAWAEGKKIQYLTPEGVWTDTGTRQNPHWYTDTQYRIKPREFEEGEFYPCRLKSGLVIVACYSCTGFYHLGHTFSTNDFQKIGSKVEIEWND